MTEQEWLGNPNLWAMLYYVNDLDNERRLRLFAYACCSRIRHLLSDNRLLEALHAVEQRAEGKYGDIELEQVRSEANKAVDAIEAGLYGPDGVLHANDISSSACAVLCASNSSFAPTKQYPHYSSPIGSVVFYVQSALVAPVWNATQDRKKTDEASEAEAQLQVAILRDIFGNPFCPVSLDPTCLSWHDGLLVSMAQHMYDSRDFTDMPVMADALEEAGCSDQEILSHCRQPGPHVRGCWVVDLILGKE
jgi:hypothetical protein